MKSHSDDVPSHLKELRQALDNWVLERVPHKSDRAHNALLAAYFTAFPDQLHFREKCECSPEANGVECDECMSEAEARMWLKRLRQDGNLPETLPALSLSNRNDGEQTAGIPYKVPSRAGIYVASKAHHGPMWREFRRAGRHIISTWIDESEKGMTTDWADLWRRCQTEAAEAQATIVYREADEILKEALIEVGCALTAGKPVFAVGPMDGSWQHHPLVTPCASLDQAFTLALARSSAAAAGRRPCV